MMTRPINWNEQIKDVLKDFSDFNFQEKGRFGPHYEIHSSQPNTDGIIVSPEGDFIHFINPK